MPNPSSGDSLAPDPKPKGAVMGDDTQVAESRTAGVEHGSQDGTVQSARQGGVEIEIPAPAPDTPKAPQRTSFWKKLWLTFEDDRAVLIGVNVMIVIVVASFTVLWLSQITAPPADEPTNVAGTEQGAEEPTGTEEESSEDEPNEPEEPVAPGTSLQTIVDEWLAKTRLTKAGIAIYDLDKKEMLASHDADVPMDVASIYKLFFVYAGYRQIENGAIDGNRKYLTTDDYRAGDYTLYECLDLMVRESYNGCADPILKNQGFANKAEAIMDELKLTGTSNSGLVSTADDLTRLLAFYWGHPDLTEDSWARIKDSMLNQPATRIDEETVYDWRQGLPAGFSPEVNVYDKVGWRWDGESWGIYADAAIIEFPEQGRHFSVVVITSGIGSKSVRPLKELGAKIEAGLRERL